MKRLALLLVLGCCVAPDQMMPPEDGVTVATPDGDFETVTNTRDTELQIEAPQVDGFIITPSAPQTLNASRRPPVPTPRW